MIVKLEITDDILKLISNIKFTTKPDFDDIEDCSKVGFGIDFNSVYGGNFLYERMAMILGGYSEHVIKDTSENAMGAEFDEEYTEYMCKLHAYMLDNLDNIEELVHQTVVKGGISVGTYKKIDYEGVWEKII